MKMLFTVIIIFIAIFYGIGFFTDVALNHVSFEEYNRRFFYQSQRFLNDQTRLAQDFNYDIQHRR